MKEAESSENGVAIYVPSEGEEEVEFGVPSVVQHVERIKPSRRQALADIRPDRSGNIKFVPRVVRQMTRIVTSRHESEGPKTYLTYSGGTFTLSDDEVRHEG